MSEPNKNPKRPESVLVVVYTRTGKVLLLRRVDAPEFWQSVTGSLRWDESPDQAAARELREETGLDPTGLQATGTVHCYPILPRWRARYAPEIQHNIEHVYHLALPQERSVSLNAREHEAYGWYDFDHAAAKVFSWSNRAELLKLREIR